jgi:hypothetical protein
VLVPTVVAVAVEDAAESNHEPCSPDPDASRAEYPLGVLIVVLAASPAKNIAGLLNACELTRAGVLLIAVPDTELTPTVVLDPRR